MIMMTRTQIEKMLLDILNHFGEYPELTEEEMSELVDSVQSHLRSTPYNTVDRDYEC